jgi:predicted TIM-barrel fold metal-dependent hydrolase
MAKSNKTTLIDSHLHMGSADGIDNILRVKKDCGLSAFAFMSLSQSSQERMAQNVAGLLLKALHPKEAFIFGGLHYHLPGRPFTDIDAAAQARRLVEIGCDGIKMLEGKPTVRKDLGIPLDAPLYDEYYGYLQDAQVPLLFHVADPETFWDPAACPAWAKKSGWFYDSTFPTKQQLYHETEGVLRKFPRLKVVFAHFFFLSADVGKAADFLERHPCANLDITPGSEMYFNFSQHSEAWHDFYTKYQDRIFFGTDNTDRESAPAPGDRSNAAARVGWMLQFLQTDGAFPAFGGEIHGIGLSKQAVAKICHGNFQRHVSRKPRPLNLGLAIEQTLWTIEQARASRLSGKLVPVLETCLGKLKLTSRECNLTSPER